MDRQSFSQVCCSCEVDSDKKHSPTSRFCSFCSHEECKNCQIKLCCQCDHDRSTGVSFCRRCQHRFCGHCTLPTISGVREKAEQEESPSDEGSMSDDSDDYEEAKNMCGPEDDGGWVDTVTGQVQHLPPSPNREKKVHRAIEGPKHIRIDEPLQRPKITFEDASTQLRRLRQRKTLNDPEVAIKSKERSNATAHIPSPTSAVSQKEEREIDHAPHVTVSTTRAVPEQKEEKIDQTQYWTPPVTRAAAKQPTEEVVESTKNVDATATLHGSQPSDGDNKPLKRHNTRPLEHGKNEAIPEPIQDNPNDEGHASTNQRPRISAFSFFWAAEHTGFVRDTFYAVLNIADYCRVSEGSLDRHRALRMVAQTLHQAQFERFMSMLEQSPPEPRTGSLAKAPTRDHQQKKEDTAKAAVSTEDQPGTDATENKKETSRPPKMEHAGLGLPKADLQTKRGNGGIRYPDQSRPLKRLDIAPVGVKVRPYQRETLEEHRRRNIAALHARDDQPRDATQIEAMRRLRRDFQARREAEQHRRSDKDGEEHKPQRVPE